MDPAFGANVLAGVTANLLFVALTAVVGLFVYPYISPGMKFWRTGIRISQFRYDLVISSREDERRHYRPSGGEMDAAFALTEFINDFWRRRFIRATVGRPKLSELVRREHLSIEGVILFGGPKWNKLVRAELDYLAKHLPLTFVSEDEEFFLRNKVDADITYRIEREGDADQGNYKDYGVIIRYIRAGVPHFLFAGLGGQGTLAAVNSVIRADTSRQLYRKLRWKHKGEFFALVEVQVRNFVAEPPEIVFVGSLLDHRSSSSK